MKKIRNFRDIGGLEVQDGRKIRKGMLYRCGSLHRASKADIRKLSELGIDIIVDLRSSEERGKYRSRLPASGNLAVHCLPILDQANSTLLSEVASRVWNKDFEDFDVDKIMENTNREFVSDWSDQFAGFFRILLSAKAKPVLWHCTGGKDRTGFSSAILLRVLGAGMDGIIRDYLVSFDHPPLSDWQLTVLRIWRGKQTADIIRHLMSVRANWIEAAFDEIDRIWGSFDAYRAEALGISDKEVRTLQDLLLE
ncbi:tyrosine-protein phosphatase [Spirochaeta dissipatitropha]